MRLSLWIEETLEGGVRSADRRMLEGRKEGNVRIAQARKKKKQKKEKGEICDHPTPLQANHPCALNHFYPEED